MAFHWAAVGAGSNTPAVSKRRHPGGSGWPVGRGGKGGQTGGHEGKMYVVIGDRSLGSLTRSVFENMALRAQIALHVRVLAGRDPDHLVEAQFKALARALRAAVALDPRIGGIPSTKGAL